MERRTTIASWLAAALIQLVFLANLAWIAQADIYQQHFFDHGPLIAGYNASRTLFIAMLAWLLYATGYGLMRACFGDRFTQGPASHRYIVSFLAGGAIWHLLLFIAGLAGWYHKPVAQIGTTLALLATLPHMAALLQRSQLLKQAAQGYILPLIALAGIAVLLLITKGLYPAGGHDYYNHYFHFYRAVVRDGIIQPNEVWYHFFNSKGATLYFYAMLIADPLAVQLVTSAFVYSGAVIVAALLRPYFRTAHIPLLGAGLYLLFYVYTPGPIGNHRQGGWGDFEKIHEITAVLFLGLVYLLQALIERRDMLRNACWLALHLVMVLMAILNFYLTVLVGVVLALCVLLLAIARRWREATGVIAVGISAGVALIIVLAINYAYTGMLLDNTGVYWGWKWANLARIQQWGVLFEVLSAHVAYTGMNNSSPPYSWEIGWNILTFLRLELWWPLLLVAALGMANKYVFLRNRPAPVTRFRRVSFLLCLALVLMVVMFAFTAAGHTVIGAISAYRMFSLSYGVMLCFCLMTWAWLPAFRKRITVIALCVALVVTGAAGYHITRDPQQVGQLAYFTLRAENAVKRIVTDARRFARGRYSIRDAYANQQGWPGRTPWSAIFPGMEDVWRIVPRGARILSFGVNTYCMLPDCRVEGWASYRLARDWESVFYKDAEHVRATLQAEGLNYFFFTDHMIGIQSLLPGQSQLFLPENIGTYLAIRWTDGKSYLLTWPGPDTRPIDEAFMTLYRKRVAECNFCRGMPRDAFRQVLDTIAAHPGQTRAFELPWDKH